MKRELEQSPFKAYEFVNDRITQIMGPREHVGTNYYDQVYIVMSSSAGRAMPNFKDQLRISSHDVLSPINDPEERIEVMRYLISRLPIYVEKCISASNHDTVGACFCAVFGKSAMVDFFETIEDEDLKKELIQSYNQAYFDAVKSAIQEILREFPESVLIMSDEFEAAEFDEEDLEEYPNLARTVLNMTVSVDEIVGDDGLKPYELR